MLSQIAKAAEYFFSMRPRKDAASLRARNFMYDFEVGENFSLPMHTSEDASTEVFVLAIHKKIGIKTPYTPKILGFTDKKSARHPIANSVLSLITKIIGVGGN